MRTVCGRFDARDLGFRPRVIAVVDGDAEDLGFRPRFVVVLQVWRGL